MAVRDIERELELLSAFRAETSSELRREALRKALRDKVNVIVARAAKIAGEVEDKTLVPELCYAFARLLLDPIKSDPKCWGKEAIAKTLKDLGHSESAIFLKCIDYVQLEPVWGGEEDTAATLRATCALALLQCTDVTRDDKLWSVMRLLSDKSPTVRKDAATALEALEGREAALMLRIAARMGDRDPTVTGQVLESLLRIEREAAVPFVADFLKSPSGEVREEAALALGASRLDRAVEALTGAFAGKHAMIEHGVLLRALSISRHEKAIEFLLDVVRTQRVSIAVAALEELKLFRDSTEMRDKIAAVVAVRTEPEIERVFRNFLL